jgi:hypothetical protein
VIQIRIQKRDAKILWIIAAMKDGEINANCFQIMKGIHLLYFLWQ